jgi:hypothetical protein
MHRYQKLYGPRAFMFCFKSYCTHPTPHLPIFRNLVPSTLCPYILPSFNYILQFCFSLSFSCTMPPVFPSMCIFLQNDVGGCSSLPHPIGGGGGVGEGFASQLGMGCSVVYGTCCPVHVRLTFTSEKWRHSWVCYTCRVGR